MKKLIILILTVSLLSVSVFPLLFSTALAESDSQGLEFAIRGDNEYYVIVNCDSDATVIVIPDTFNGLPVKGWSYNAFSDCVNLKSVTVGNNIHGITYNSFLNLTKLEYVYIPSGVQLIDDRAFEGCSALKSITIPDTVVEIGDSAFKNCSSIVNLYIPASVTTMDGYVLNGMSSLKYVYCGAESKPEGWSDYWAGAVQSAYYTQIIWGYDPNSAPAEFIDEQEVTYKLNSDGISYTVSKYNRLSSRTSVVIPKTAYGLPVTEIGENAFKSSVYIESITLPEGLKKINERAFYNCGKLQSMNIPSTVEFLDEECFGVCSALTSINIPSSITAIPERMLYYCISINKVELPNSIVTIGNEAFFYCEGLKEINIPSAVTSIGNSAFEQCYNLKTISIPKSVEAIGNKAFNYCNRMDEISCEAEEMPSGWDTAWLGDCKANVTWNGEGTVFYDTTGNIALNKNYTIYGYTYIDDVFYTANLTDGKAKTTLSYDENWFAFFYLENDSAINAPNGIGTITIDLGKNYNISAIKMNTVVGENVDNSGIFGPERVSAYVFNDDNGDISYIGDLTGDPSKDIDWMVLEPNNAWGRFVKIEVELNGLLAFLNEIAIYGEEANEPPINPNPSTPDEPAPDQPDPALTFVLSSDGTYYIVSDCDDNAEFVWIPATYNGLPVKEIADKAFANCKYLTGVVIPNGITKIGMAAFGASGLTSVHIPASVTYMGINPFAACVDLLTITVDTENLVFHSEDGCLIETNRKYLVCGSKSSVIPTDGSVAIIGDSAFSGISITNLVIPSSVTRIEQYAFFGTSTLKSVTLSEGLLRIDNNAFCCCSGLTSITIPKTVTTIFKEAFAICSNLKNIYCNVSKKPFGWVSGWDSGCNATIHWLEDESQKDENKDEPVLLGDINGSNEIDSMDYVLAKRAYFGTFTLSDEQFKLADVNNSGEIDSMDYVLIKRDYFGTFKINK